MKISEKAKMLMMAGVLAIAGIGMALVPAGSVWAANKVGGMNNGINAATTNDMQNGNVTSIVKTISDVFMYAVGAVSVIMIIYGGFQYVTSSGDQTKVTKAKNTILYGLVGLAIAILARAIVGFVLDNIGN